MHGKTKVIGTYTVYEVYVDKTQAITYLYGHDWKKFMYASTEYQEATSGKFYTWILIYYCLG